MKRITVLIGLLIVLFSFFLYILFSPKNYRIKYKVNGTEVVENYYKRNKYYLFTINYKTVKYPLKIYNEYTRKRKLVKKITINEEDNIVCLNVNALSKTSILCSEDNELKDLNLLNTKYLEEYYGIANEKASKLGEYKKIGIYDKSNDYFIWNYKGFYHLSEDNDSIDIFNDDNYKNYLSYQTDRYLIFPDYDSEYYFQKLYIYDVQKEKLNTLDIEDEVSYESYFLGHLDNKVYLLDKKNKKEYEINLKKETIKEISDDNYIKFYNKKWTEISINKLINNEQTFTYKERYDYILEDETLYLVLDKINIQVSNLKVKKIVYINDDTVYYLSDNKLYSYKYLDKEKLLLQYNEWNFNYNNHIFIFN